MRRFPAVVFVVVLALAAGLAAAPQTSALASSPGAKTHSSGFWVTMTPGSTFAQAVSAAAQKSPGQVTAGLKRMLQREEAGQAIYIPETKNGILVNVKASRADLTGALAAIKKTAATTAAVAGTAQTAVPAAGPAVSGAPSTWPVRGEACGSNRAWCDLVYVLDLDECDPSCTLEDQLTARLTVNPSASGTNRVNWNVLYSPDNGDFDGYHFEWYFLKYAAETECGTGNTGSWSTSNSGYFDTTCNVVLWDSRNTTAVVFWGHIAASDGWVNDWAKDGTALCQPESSGNTYCVY
jgi:hypothetical protein